jgi:hypothetical protein
MLYKVESATIATAKAIETASKIKNTSELNNQSTQLRISNLERQLLQQKHTTNEILNHIKKQKTNKDNKQRSPTIPPPYNPFTTINRPTNNSNYKNFTTSQKTGIAQQQSNT